MTGRDGQQPKGTLLLAKLLLLHEILKLRSATKLECP